MTQRVQVTDSAQIRFDFDQANRQISVLTSLSAQLKRLSSGSYAQSVSQVRSAWSGSGANTFLEKAQTLQEKIDETAAALQKAAESYQEAVGRARAAEEAAKEIILESGE